MGGLVRAASWSFLRLTFGRFGSGRGLPFGTASSWPGKISCGLLSLLLFAEYSASTVTPRDFAIPERVSPAFTVYVMPVDGGVPLPGPAAIRARIRLRIDVMVKPRGSTLPGCHSRCPITDRSFHP